MGWAERNSFLEEFSGKCWQVDSRVLSGVESGHLSFRLGVVWDWALEADPLLSADVPHILRGAPESTSRKPCFWSLLILVALP